MSRLRATNIRTGQVYEQGPDELDLAIGEWIISDFDRRRLLRAELPPPVPPIMPDPRTEEEWKAIDQKRQETYDRYLNGEREHYEYDSNDDSETEEA